MPAFAAILEDLYAGALDDIAWRRGIGSLTDFVRGSAALLLAFNPSSGVVLRDENHRFDARVLDSYRRHWTFEDPRRVHFMTVPVGQPTTEVLLSIDGWRGSSFLNEFLLPADAPHILPVWLYKGDTKAVALSVQGTRRRGPFNDDDVAKLRMLSPHIARALAIRDRLEATRVRADTLVFTLNRATFGVIILDGTGRILETNCAADQLLRVDSGIRRNADATLILRGTAGHELRRWILAGQPPALQDGLLHVPRLHGSPISVLLTPLPGIPTSWVVGDPRWLVLVFDPERRIEASGGLIGADLGISPREAEVCALLVSGCTPLEIAARLDISPHTARNHLKSILRKTALRSQADLIRRIATGPRSVPLARTAAEC